MDGGQLLNSRVSGALLESLFDPHSDGHDGAVIVDGDYVARFGVHLPLSKHMDPDSGLGTRHAAALGLAEFTDAFLSGGFGNERTVMVAREGVLMNMGDGNRLRKPVGRFFREKYQSPAPVRTWKLLWKNPVDKGLSLTLGLMLWLVFAKGIRQAEQTFSVPVQVAKVPAGVQVEAISPPNVEVTLRGLERDLHMLPSGTVIALRPAISWHLTQTITLTSDLVHVSPHLRVAAISPNTITLHTKKKPEPHKAFKMKTKHGKHTGLEFANIHNAEDLRGFRVRARPFSKHRQPQAKGVQYFCKGLHLWISMFGKQSVKIGSVQTRCSRKSR